MDRPYSKRGTSYSYIRKSYQNGDRPSQVVVNAPREYVEQEVALSNKSIAKDLSYKHLKDENKRLRGELHELRKMQAGWFGKDKVRKEVRIENHHYLHEKELLE